MLPSLRFVALSAALAMPAAAQQLSLSFGGTELSPPRDRTFGARVEYRHDIAPWLAGSLAYVNEGHVPGHHRDGVGAQLWLQTPLTAPGWRFAVGAGGYQFFDTTLAETADGYRNAHGFGRAYGAIAEWWPRSTWFLQARVDRHELPRSLDATMLLVGIGAPLDQDGSFLSNHGRRGATADEVTAYAGQTVVNSFASQKSTAHAVEWRRELTPIVRASLAWMHEGDARLIRRNGAIAQAWLEPSFRDRAWSLGFGAGAYVAVDHYRHEGHHLLPAVATTISHRFTGAVAARLNWYRIASRSDRDSDIFLLGVGFLF